MSDSMNETMNRIVASGGRQISHLKASEYVRHYILKTKPIKPIRMVSLTDSNYLFENLLESLGSGEGIQWQFTKLIADAQKARRINENESILGTDLKALHTTKTEWLTSTDEQVDIVYFEYDRPWGPEIENDIGLIAWKKIFKMLIISFPLDKEKSDFAREIFPLGNPRIDYLSWWRQEVPDSGQASGNFYGMGGLPHTIIGIFQDEKHPVKMLAGSVGGRLLSIDHSHTQTVMTLVFEPVEAIS